jgi:hypothetical protein
LSDKNATRHNIIDAFRKRFANLPEGSIALFHFSGHGSWEKTSAEFVEAGIEAPGGKNETLVPYDGGNSGNKNITDKELRLLVAELQVDQPTPFVALLDCCHSSSQFRNAVSDTGSSLFRSRLRPGNQKPRALKDYLEGQFVNKDQLVLSDINYVSISACAAHEYALEGNDGGIFTTALIQLLEKYLQAGTWPSYATLFGAINARVLNQGRHQQHPQFEYKGDFNPADSFLSVTDTTMVDLLPISFDKIDGWIAQQGCIGGADPLALINQYASIYRRQAENNDLVRVGLVKVLKVGVEKTSFDTPQVAGNLDPQNEELFVELPLYGLPVTILDNVDPGLANQLRSLFANPSLYRFYEDPSASVCISYTQNNLINLSTKEPNVEVSFSNKSADRQKLVRSISGYLAQIARWRGLLKINKLSEINVEPGYLELYSRRGHEVKS